MVVAENGRSKRKAPGSGERAGPRPVRLLQLAALGCLSLAPPQALADIVADRSAPLSQQPLVAHAANGVPQVNIQAPSAAGVSRNSYSQFDINPQGAILNNARGNVKSQLGGWIEGNRNLANARARVILNEVNASLASQLRGYLEVAGDRAQVVVANPAGIVCDGCGFINANRASLLAGSAQLASGQLQAYVPSDGSIRIQGKGLDASQTDFTQLIAQTVEVNAGVWARELQINAGTTPVDADGQVLPHAVSGEPGRPAPRVAIDVAQLGGMYAGKIALVGNGSGVGVRNAGQIGASAGDVVISADGRIENLGQLSASRDVKLDGAAGIDNSGSLHAANRAELRSAGRIHNSGIAAGQHLRLHAQAISNAAQAVLAAGLSGSGEPGASGNLELQADGQLNSRGGLHAAGTLDIAGAQLELAQTRAFARDMRMRASGDIDLSAAQLASEGKLEVHTAGALTTANARLLGSQLQLEAQGLDNRDGELLSLGNLSLQLGGDYEHSGSLQANGDVQLRLAGRLLNPSRLVAGGQLQIAARDLENQLMGEILAQQLRITISAQLDNQGLIDGQRTHIEASRLNNTGGGRIYGDQLSIQSLQLHNTEQGQQAAVIAARGRLDIGSQHILNRERALLFSGGDLFIGGGLDASGHATGTARNVHNASATIEALGALGLRSDELHNSNEHFSIHEVETGRHQVREYQLAGSSQRHGPGQVSIFHDEVSYLVTPGGVRDRWNLYNYQRTTRETQILNSVPAQLLSGGDMQLDVEHVLNDKSWISSGGSLSGRIDQLDNTEASGRRVTTDSGTVTHFYRIQEKGRDRQGRSVAHYQPAAEVVDIFLKPGGFQEHSAVAGSGLQLGELDLGGVAPLVTPQTRSGMLESIRSGGINAWLAGNGLFSLQPKAPSGYLIESDPRFTQYRSWLSSDYMIARLPPSAGQALMRLGDGFFEQKLIREQVLQLTGRRFLEGYSSDEQQYRALLDNGITFAERWRLTPGISLTPEQMAQLTSDIVWLEYREQQLPDGRMVKALVPQLYARVREGDIDGSGALMSGDSLQLEVKRDLLNSGTIAGRGLLSLSADNLRNLGGRLSGEEVWGHARDSLNSLGGQIDARQQLVISAGQDINLASTTRDSRSQQGSATRIARVAGLFVSDPAAHLLAAAGRDLSLDGAHLQNSGGQGSTLLSAGNDLKLGTVAESDHQRMTWDTQNWRQESRQADIGSQLQVAGDLLLTSGRDLQARGATLSSELGAVHASAGRDLQLLASQSSTMTDETHQSRGGNGWLSQSLRSSRDTSRESLALATTLSAESNRLSAGQDLKLQGSNVVSSDRSLLQAGRDLSITADEEHFEQQHSRKKSKTGAFSSGGIGVTIGSQQHSFKQSEQSSRAAASTIGSLSGDIALRAGRAYQQVGSKLIAPRGDIDIAALQVDILDARNTYQLMQEQRAKQSGLSLTLSNPVISSVQNMLEMKRAASRTEDGRMKALAAASAGLQADQLATLLTQHPRQASAINIGIDIGSSRSKSTSDHSQSSAENSILRAGNDMQITATGAGPQSDIAVQSGQLQAGRNAALSAEGDISLRASQNTFRQRSRDQEGSASLGIGLAIGGAQNGLSLNAGFSRGRGSANGTDVSASNAHIDAGDTLSLQSGGDTRLSGAVARGERISTRVGGNLLIESLLDTSDYSAKERHMSATLSLCLPPVCYGSSGGSISHQNSHLDSHYASVSEQSGLRSGGAGFDVEVQGDTTLRGGLITSSQRAVEQGDNSFHTGGVLALSDLQNRAEYSGDALGVTLGSSLNPRGDFSTAGTSAGIGVVDDSANGTARAAISGIAGNSSARSEDAYSGLQPIFNSDKQQEELDAQAQITQRFGQQASTAVGDHAEQQRQRAAALRREGREQEARAIEALWGDYGTLRLAAHTTIGWLSGGGSGAAGAATGAVTAPAISSALKNAGSDQALNSALTTIGSATVAGLAGGSTGATTSLNEVANNYLSHLENQTRRLAKQDCAKGNRDACQTAEQLDALDAQRDAGFETRCAGTKSGSADCTEATQQLYATLGSFAEEAARAAASRHKSGTLTLAHKEELQSYLPLLKIAGPDTRSTAESRVRAPNLYDADPYGVIPADNTTGAYLVMKFGSEALAIANVNEGGNYASLSDWWARNGMLNKPGYAAGLMLAHVDAAAKEKTPNGSTDQASNMPATFVDRYTLSYAPTAGFLSDLWGTLLTKLGVESASVQGLRTQLESLQAGQRPVNWVVHSRGGVEFVRAARGATVDDLSKNAVVFHAGANTKWMANDMMARKGVGDVAKEDSRYRDAPNDLVPQIVGLRALSAPGHFLPALLSAGCLSDRICSVTESPHTLPYGWNNLMPEKK